jgi:hypothetical protein
MSSTEYEETPVLISSYRLTLMMKYLGIQLSGKKDNPNALFPTFSLKALPTISVWE